MKLLVLGASGGTGRLVVEAALAAGHEVTGFVRDPARLSLSHSNLSKVVGNISNPSAIEATLPGHDAVISNLGVGTTFKSDPEVISGIRYLVSAMERLGLARLVYQSFLGVGDTRKLLGPILGGVVVPLLLLEEVADHAEKERVIRASALDWAILRSPRLTNRPATGVYRFGRALKPTHWFPSTPRGDVARLMLSLAEQPNGLRQLVEMLA